MARRNRYLASTAVNAAGTIVQNSIDYTDALKYNKENRSKINDLKTPNIFAVEQWIESESLFTDKIRIGDIVLGFENHLSPKYEFLCLVDNSSPNKNNNQTDPIHTIAETMNLDKMFTRMNYGGRITREAYIQYCYLSTDGTIMLYLTSDAEIFDYYKYLYKSLKRYFQLNTYLTTIMLSSYKAILSSLSQGYTAGVEVFEYINNKEYRDPPAPSRWDSFSDNIPSDDINDYHDLTELTTLVSKVAHIKTNFKKVFKEDHYHYKFFEDFYLGNPMVGHFFTNAIKMTAEADPHFDLNIKYSPPVSKNKSHTDPNSVLNASGFNM